MLTLRSTWAPQPTTERIRRTPLSYDATNDRIAYASGKIVVIRSVKEPNSSSTLYTEHVYPVSSVAFAPSGHYIATGDTSGQVRIWNTTGDNVTTKGPFAATSGSINAIAWDHESKRIMAVGDGKERFGHAFSWDMGTSIGEIGGHSSKINGVAIRPCRPLRAATVGEDTKLVFYTGVPFKFLKTVNKHTSPISDVAYSPDGSLFATAGCDRKVGLYDGISGEFKCWLNAGHDASVLAIAWKGNDKVVSAAVDCTVRVTDVNENKCVRVYELPKKPENHQTGVVVTPENVISVSHEGTLYYWGDDSKPSRSIEGPQRCVTALVTSLEKHHVYSATLDGKVFEWTNGLAHCLPYRHDGPVLRFVQLHDALQSVGWDKTVRSIIGKTSVTLAYQPVDVAAADSQVVAVSEDALEIGGKVKSLDGQGYAVDYAKGIAAVGVGMKVILVDSEMRTIGELGPARSHVSSVKFSPCGQMVAVGDGSGKIVLYNVEKREIITSRWAFHTSRVTSMAWHRDGDHIATGATDSNIYVYSVRTPSKNLKKLAAHKDGVTNVAWQGDTLVSSGSYGEICIWDVILQS